MRENFSIREERPTTFVVRKSELEDRFDPRYYKPAYLTIISGIERKYELKTLKEISTSINSGATPLAKGDAYVEKDRGIPFIRSGDLTRIEILTPSKTYHSASFCNCFLLLKPSEIAMPAKRTEREVCLVTEGSVNLCILSKENVFFITLITSSIKDLFDLNTSQSRILRLKSLKIPFKYCIFSLMRYFLS